MTLKKEKNIRKLYVTKQNLILGLLLLFFLSILMTNITHRNFKNDLFKQEVMNQEAVLVGKRLALMSYISTVSSGLKYLATSYDPNLKEYAKNLKQYIELNSDYYQVRLIDTTGMEKIRIYEKYGSAVVEKEENLQNLSNHPHFREGMLLHQGEISFSSLDLNTENGEIEKPYRPTLRMFTPVFINNEKVGVLGVNINAYVFLNDLSNEDVILLNKDMLVFSGLDNLYQKCSIDFSQMINKVGNTQYSIQKIPFNYGNKISWWLVSRKDLSEYAALTDANRNRLLGLLAIIFIAITLLGYFYSLLESTNSALGIEKTMHDERKLSEQRYKALSEELLEANELKELFLDIVSHDLKNPTGVILGMSDLLIEEDKDNEIYKQIYNSSKSLVDTLNNVTGLSRVIQHDEIEKEELDLAQILDNCILEVDTFLRKSDMTLEKRYPPTFPIVANSVTTDIYRNFLSNAIKYASQGKKIIIEVIKENGWVEVRVIDFGVTIEGEDKERIFLRGKQLANGFKRGNGLGLSIVKKIAIAHHGEVGVRENSPRGNIFFYRFPQEDNE